MFRHAARRALFAIALLAGLITPATASAWTVTVHVHGAGKVDETTARNLMDCTTPSATPESTPVDCVAGTANGLYNSFDVINLRALVPTEYFDRGWRFSKWVDSSAGGGQINCDPQNQSGDHTNIDCQFQIFENLETNLYFDDTFGPNATSISQQPASVTNSTSATFNFDASDDPDAFYDCRLDRPGQPAGSFVACGSDADKSESYASLATNGQYTFYVRGRDPSGNVDATPASYSWTVDTVTPTVTIGGSPSSGTTTSSSSASFTVTSNEGTPSCTLDGQATACGTPKTGLADGSHSFAAQATDAAGNTGTASRTWTVDTTAPQTSITGGPDEGGVSGAAPEFAFTSSEGNSTFTCTLDGVDSPCTSPRALSNLGEGPHTFSVVATDAVGNTDSTPATRAWTVDLTPPETQLLGGPAEGSTTPDRAAQFTFASPESASTFECRVDDLAFAACSSPKTYSDLALGDHTFEVRAKDAAGNVDASPEKRAWRVNSLDADADGINRPQDCRDDDPAIHPGAVDTPGDGIDQDCDGADAVDLDRDRDGVQRPTDCNDDNPAIRPGATEVVADGVDQDCDLQDARLPQVSAAVVYKWGPPRARTKVVKLLLSKLQPGAKVAVSCRGKRCPIKKRSVKAPATGKVDVRKLLKRKSMPAGTKLKIVISEPEHVSKVLLFGFRRGKSPTGGIFGCLAPGAAKPVSCSVGD